MYATDGDETLGGSDFDLCLYDIIKHKVNVVDHDLWYIIPCFYLWAYVYFTYGNINGYVVGGTGVRSYCEVAFIIGDGQSSG